MIRWLLSLFALAVLLGGGAMYRAYGEIEPCRALAVERARHDAHGLPLEGAIAWWTRLETGQKSTGACARELAASWFAGG
ncbi:MAG TPA: hypothetical protein VMH86_15995 [Rhizomicrobium sp.]|nr:hypothetical protein [Rhizomicrobium sp.]